MYLFNDDGCLHSDISDNPNISVLRQKSSMQWFTLPGASFRCWEGPEVRSAAWGRGGSSGISFLPSGNVDLDSLIIQRLYHMSFTRHGLCDVADSMSSLNAQQDALGEHSQTEWGGYCPPAIQTRSSTSNPGSASQRTRHEEVSRADDDY